MPNIFVTGGRKFNNYRLLCNFLNLALQHLADITILHGGALGTDTLAQRYAEERGYPTVVLVPDYERFANRKIAPLMRNTELARRSQYCIAFWDGESGGTKDAFTKAQRTCVKAALVRYDIHTQQPLLIEQWERGIKMRELLPAIKEAAS